MARQADWQKEIGDAIRRNPASTAWSLTGENRLIKVVRPEDLMNTPEIARAVGYVTQEKFLFGKMPADIQTDLGLPPFCFKRGCRVFRLVRLPLSFEYTDELDASMPDGRAFDVNDAMEARERYLNDPWLSEVPYYPAGSSRIPQWRVSVMIPLIHLTDLWPLVAYPRSSI